jgi:hypothetical protein
MINQKFLFYILFYRIIRSIDMSYVTTVTTVNNEGRPIKAEVFCGGRSQGFSDPNTGTISFSMSTRDEYSVSAKRYGESASATIRGGQEIVLRLK